MYKSTLCSLQLLYGDLVAIYSCFHTNKKQVLHINTFKANHIHAFFANAFCIQIQEQWAQAIAVQHCYCYWFGAVSC